MSQQEKGFPKRVLSFILNIGADPQDSEYIRLVKRIYYVSSVVSLPVSILSTFLYYVSGDYVSTAIFLFSFAFFSWFLVNGALFPNNFERNATFSERLLRRIEKDLEQAAMIQRDLLPKENPCLEGFDITGMNIPCYQVGGASGRNPP